MTTLSQKDSHKLMKMTNVKLCLSHINMVQFDLF